MFMRLIISLFVVVLCLSSATLLAEEFQKNRVIILSDIEADPDDTQSFVRLFLYSNQIDIRGIVATTSCWLKSEIHPESINKVINAYGQVQANLIQHEAGFPSPDTLLKRVKQGLPVYGMLGVGQGHDSQGSEWILQELEKVDERPLWISVWGGVNTLAQTLYKIKHTKTPAEAKRLIAKLRIYTISDQDDSGIWIRNHFPDLFYIVSPGDYYGSATWLAINSVIGDIDNTTISNPWLAKHIQQGHGPLGAIYPDVAWGMEGDTPAFLSLIPNGLNMPEHPEWGGWGGRYEYYQPEYDKNKQGSVSSGVPYEPETRAIWTDTEDSYDPYIANDYGRSVKKLAVPQKSNRATLWRWRDDFQHDFAARMDWSTKSYAEANHPPVPVLSQPERITLKSGQGFMLDASGSYDPDGDSLSVLWFQYLEAGSYQQEIKLGPPENSNRVFGHAPEVDKQQTVHIVLKVTDKGEPQLSRYKRVILTVEPK